MKNIYLILIISCVMISCKSKNAFDKRQSIIDSTSILKTSSKDTIYLKNDSNIVPESIYLNLDSIKIGKPFTDKANVYGYYRLLFSSSEETRSFYIEKINIVGDGIVKLEKRFKIPPQVLGLDSDFPSIDLIKWQAPDIIEISVNGQTMQLDISKMKAQNLSN